MSKWLLSKLRKLLVLFSNSGSYKAWRKGHYLDVYAFVYRLKKMGYNPQTVIDVGANRGMFSKTIHYVFPTASIIAFEPLKDCFDELNRMREEISQLRCFNVALSDIEGSTVIHRSSSDYSSSLLEMEMLHKSVFPHTAGETNEAIKMTTLDSVVDADELLRPIMLKIDVQGYEKKVLDGADRLLEKTDIIICEMSFRRLYKDQPLFDEIYSFLNSKGFIYVGSIGELVNPLTTEILQIDGLFIRRDTNL